MISRRDLLCAGALAPLSTYSFAAPAYKAGKEYLTVHPMAPTPADKIEVVEFFAYTCPHCLQFHPVFHEWAQKAPEDVSIRICPVAWQPKYLPFTDTYFALEALGLLDSLSMPFFESIIYQTRSYNFDSATRDIHDFMVEAGVDGAKWDATFNSFGVKNKSRNATMLWNAYQIDSTPMVGVGGKFTTGPHLAGSRQDRLPRRPDAHAQKVIPNVIPAVLRDLHKRLRRPPTRRRLVCVLGMSTF